MKSIELNQEELHQDEKSTEQLKSTTQSFYAISIFLVAVGTLILFC